MSRRRLASDCDAAMPSVASEVVRSSIASVRMASSNPPDSSGATSVPRAPTAPIRRPMSVV